MTAIALYSHRPRPTSPRWVTTLNPLTTPPMPPLAHAKDHVAAVGGALVTEASSVTYRRRPARLWNEALAARFLPQYSQLDASLGWQGLACLNDAVVVGDGYLFTDDGTLISDSVPGGPHRPWPANQRAAAQQRERALARAPLLRCERPALLLRQIGAGNYGHWLLDALPRLISAQRALPELDQVWVHPRNLELATQTLKWVAPAITAKPLPECLRFSRLWWPSLCSDPPAVHHPASVPALRRAFARTARGTTQVTRLFVARDDIGNRRLRNDDAVWTLLKGRGFTRINCGGMPINEQIDRFRGAEMVVGILGASLTNAVFSDHLKRFIVLCPATMPGLFYWDLAHHMAVDIDLLFGPVVDQSSPTTSDFEVPVRLLEQVLDS